MLDHDPDRLVDPVGFLGGEEFQRLARIVEDQVLEVLVVGGHVVLGG